MNFIQNIKNNSLLRNAFLIACLGATLKVPGTIGFSYILSKPELRTPQLLTLAFVGALIFYFISAGIGLQCFEKLGQNVLKKLSLKRIFHIIGFGFLLALFMAVWMKYLPPQIELSSKAVDQTPSLAWMLVRLEASVREELYLRLLILGVLWFLLRKVTSLRTAAITAVVLSSFLFGIGHLPFAASQLGAETSGLSTSLTFKIVLGNFFFGLPAGFLMISDGFFAAVLLHLVSGMSLMLLS